MKLKNSLQDIKKNPQIFAGVVHFVTKVCDLHVGHFPLSAKDKKLHYSVDVEQLTSKYTSLESSFPYYVIANPSMLKTEKLDGSELLKGFHLKEFTVWTAFSMLRP